MPRSDARSIDDVLFPINRRVHAAFIDEAIMISVPVDADGHWVAVFVVPIATFVGPGVATRIFVVAITIQMVDRPKTGASTVAIRINASIRHKRLVARRAFPVGMFRRNTLDN